jgi:hypothetical protein
MGAETISSGSAVIFAPTVELLPPPGARLVSFGAAEGLTCAGDRQFFASASVWSGNSGGV